MDMRSMASLYGDARSAAMEEGEGAVREPDFSLPAGLPDERTLQLLLLEGAFGTSFTDDLGREVRILDFGDWNKSAGPDFLNARIRINGVPQAGDIELDPAPEDWERHGHGSNPAFSGVILHLACAPSRREWFTRNARHKRIPLAVIPPAALARAKTAPSGNAPVRHCRHADLLTSMPPELLETLLESAAAYRFRNTSGQAWTAAFGVNPGYTISNVRVNGAEVPFSVSDYQEYNEAMLEVALPSDREIELTMDYGGFPRENRNVSIMQGGTEISSEYLCLENAGLSPRLINVLPGENGYPTTIEITLPASMSVIPFGASKAEVVAEQTDGTKTWRYDSNSAGGILYAGDYIRQDIQAGGMDIEFYYGRKHQAVMEAAGAAEAVKSVVDYCTAHYGMLSFGTGDTLKLIQSRVTGGGYAANGASLLDEADFTADNLSDTGKGGGAGEVMIHELVHQWWGLGNMFDASDESSLWSAEGLTVYTTYRIVKERYGPSYAQEHYVDQWQQAVDNYYLNFYVRNPDYLEALPEEERLEISNSLRYVRQYCEMPLKILKAEQLVGGEEAMDRILRGLFNRELDPMYPYLTYQDFLNACGLTEEDLNLA